MTGSLLKLLSNYRADRANLWSIGQTSRRAFDAAEIQAGRYELAVKAGSR